MFLIIRFKNRCFSLIFSGTYSLNQSVKSNFSFLLIFHFFCIPPHMISFSIFTYFFHIFFLFPKHVLKKVVIFFSPYGVSNNIFLLFFYYRIFWRFFPLWSKKSHFRYLFSENIFYSSKIVMFYTTDFRNRCFSTCFFHDQLRKSSVLFKTNISDSFANVKSHFSTFFCSTYFTNNFSKS